MIVAHAAYGLPTILLPTVPAGGSISRAFCLPSMLGSTVWTTALFPCNITYESSLLPHM